jgi:dolichyl-phosphate beta-glucosyltransferase
MSLTGLSIIIPAFNEADRLPGTLDKFITYLKSQEYTYEIIVVDDGSTDGTPTIIEEKYPNLQVRVIKQPKNMGKGAAVKTGVLASVGQEVLFSDADGSTPIEELQKLQNKLEAGFDLAIGNRRDDSLIGQKQPFYRIWLGKAFNSIVKSLLGAPIEDTQCGFKLIKGELARALFAKMKIDGFSFDVELLHLTFKQKGKVAEVPVVWINDERSKVVVWRDPIIMFFELLKIKMLHN